MSDIIHNLALSPHDYPDVLYRVHLSGRSATNYDASGFHCLAAGRIDICNYSQLADALEYHLDWYSGVPSHLISTFGTYNRAVRWARKQLRRFPGTSAYLMTIDPQEVTNARGRYNPILQVIDVVDQYPEMLPQNIREEWVDDEFLVLYKIPADAIIETQRVYL
ncbi:hypothetical protein ABW21_db0200535 [Orbilia brochopaga]|nr:hypothetical protein ABW21_db0200535 [Drechslerella brochopaga]